MCIVEMKCIEFKEEVLNKEKELLSQFANHISNVHFIKVGDPHAVNYHSPLFMIVCTP